MNKLTSGVAVIWRVTSKLLDFHCVQKKQKRTIFGNIDLNYSDQ